MLSATSKRCRSEQNKFCFVLNPNEYRQIVTFKGEDNLLLVQYYVPLFRVLFLFVASPVFLPSSYAAIIDGPRHANHSWCNPQKIYSFPSSQRRFIILLYHVQQSTTRDATRSSSCSNTHAGSSDQLHFGTGTTISTSTGCPTTTAAAAATTTTAAAPDGRYRRSFGRCSTSSYAFIGITTVTDHRTSNDAFLGCYATSDGVGTSTSTAPTTQSTIAEFAHSSVLGSNSGTNIVGWYEYFMMIVNMCRLCGWENEIGHQHHFSALSFFIV
jgi:hypothetical protein